MPDGLLGPPQVGTSDAAALRAIARAAPRGAALACSPFPPEFAAAAARLGFVPTPAPRDAIRAATALALAFAYPEKLRGAPLPGDLVVELGLAARELARARPWLHWDGDTCLDGVIAVGSRSAAQWTSRCSATPPRRSASPSTGAATTSGSSRARARRTSTACRCGPKASRRSCARCLSPPSTARSRRSRSASAAGPRRASTSATLELLAFARALARLSPTSRSVRAEATVDDGLPVVAEVSAPPAND